jgi:hypothetical protein
MRITRVVCVGVFAAWLLAASAQEPKPADTPPKSADAVPGPFRSYIVLDQRTDPKDPKGKRNVTGFQHDLIVETGLGPAVVVFSRAPATKADDPLAKLVGKLKELGTTFEASDLGTYLIFPILDKSYADDPKAKETADTLKRWAEQVVVGPVVVGLSEKEAEKTKAWGLPEAGTVIVFVNRQKVLKRWDLDAGKLTEEVGAEVVAAVTKELKK